MEASHPGAQSPEEELRIEENAGQRRGCRRHGSVARTSPSLRRNGSLRRSQSITEGIADDPKNKDGFMSKLKRRFSFRKSKTQNTDEKLSEVEPTDKNDNQIRIQPTTVYNKAQAKSLGKKSLIPLPSKLKLENVKSSRNNTPVTSSITKATHNGHTLTRCLPVMNASIDSRRIKMSSQRSSSPSPELQLPPDGNLYDFNREQIANFFLLAGVPSEKVKDCVKANIDGRRFSKMKEKDMDRFGLSVPLVIRFRRATHKRMPVFML